MVRFDTTVVCPTFSQVGQAISLHALAPLPKASPICSFQHPAWNVFWWQSRLFVIFGARHHTNHQNNIQWQKIKTKYNDIGCAARTQNRCLHVEAWIRLTLSSIHMPHSDVDADWSSGIMFCHQDGHKFNKVEVRMSVTVPVPTEEVSFKRLGLISSIFQLTAFNNSRDTVLLMPSCDAIVLMRSCSSRCTPLSSIICIFKDGSFDAIHSTADNNLSRACRPTRANGQKASRWGGFGGGDENKLVRGDFVYICLLTHRYYYHID